MIKIDGKTCLVSISGQPNDLLVEMTTMIHTLYEKMADICYDEEFLKEVFDHCYDMAFISDDEIREKVNDEFWEKAVGEE